MTQINAPSNTDYIDMFVLMGVHLDKTEFAERAKKLGLQGKLSSEKLEELAVDRVHKLSNLMDDEYKLEDDAVSDLMAHLIMRKIAISDHEGRVKTWLLNNEVMAFRNKLEQIVRLDPHKKTYIKILRILMDTDNIMRYKKMMQKLRNKNMMAKINEIKNFTGLDPDGEKGSHIITTNWQNVHKIVGSGKVRFMYKGIAMIPDTEPMLISQVAKNYRIMLEKKIKNLSDNMTVEEMNTYEEMGNRVINNIKKYSVSFLGLDQFDKEIKHFPPCIRIIDQMISTDMGVERPELLQIGFFLREVGMSLNDYRRYFYLRHPANRDKTWSEFLSSKISRYNLPHHYGKTGGGKAYLSYACKKIQLQGFCPFRDMKNEDIIEFVTKPIKDKYTTPSGKEYMERKMNHILKMKRKKYYGAACSTEFQLRFGEEHTYVNHPIKQYFEPAKRLTEQRNDEDESETERSEEEENDRNG